MDIRLQTDRGVIVVGIAGELTWATAPDAEQRILESTSHENRLVMDLSGVTFMASAGLRLLLTIHRSVSGAGGRVVLVGLSQNVRNTLEVTGFLDFFPVSESVDAAIAQLSE